MIDISFQDKFFKKENFPKILVLRISLKKENFPNFVKRNKIMLPQWKPVNVKSKYDNTI